MKGSTMPDETPEPIPDPTPDSEPWSPQSREDWVDMFSDAFKKATTPEPTPDPTPDDEPPRALSLGERLLGGKRV